MNKPKDVLEQLIWSFKRYSRERCTRETAMGLPLEEVRKETVQTNSIVESHLLEYEGIET